MRLGIKLGTRVFSISLLNLLFSILLPSSISRRVIIKGYYIGVELLIKANIVYNSKIN